MSDVSQVERRTDLVKAAGIEIGTTLGGIVIQSVADLEMISLRLARGWVAVPPHCREQPGVCFALAMQALEWGMPIMSVINKSYATKNRGVERIAYESQLLHAVIERNAPLKARLRHEILGEGDERVCRVWGTFKGEETEHSFTSETLGKRLKDIGYNDEGVLKGSPLWIEKPPVQMFYDASRDWGRLFCPEIILGAYAIEEFPSAQSVDVTPSKLEGLAQRLKDSKAGLVNPFDAGEINRTVDAVIDGHKEEAIDADPEIGERESGGEGRQDHDGDRADGDRDQAGRAESGSADPPVGQEPAGLSAEKEPEQKDIFPPDRKPKSKPKGKRR